eukprot:328728-Prymnesium_polylepis.1
MVGSCGECRVRRGAGRAARVTCEGRVRRVAGRAARVTCGKGSRGSRGGWARGEGRFPTCAAVPRQRMKP